MLLAIAALALGTVAVRKIRKARSSAQTAPSPDASPVDDVPLFPTSTNAQPATPAPLPITFVPRPPALQPYREELSSRPQPAPAQFSSPLRTTLAPTHSVSVTPIPEEEL